MPPSKPKPRPVGRPKMESGHKAVMTPLRLSAEERARVEKAAAKADLSISEWIRRTIHAAL